MANGYIVNCFNSVFTAPVYKKTFGKTAESIQIQERLKNFDANHSEALKTLNFYYGTGITHKEYVCLARIICKEMNLKLDRLAVRDHRVLVKWFDDNWEIISVIIPYIQILDENKEPITLQREIQERFNINKKM